MFDAYRREKAARRSLDNTALRTGKNPLQGDYYNIDRMWIEWAN